MGDPAVTKGKIQNVGTPGAVPIFQNAGAQPAAPAVPSNGDAYGLCATLEPLAAVPFLKGAVSFCQPVLERKAIDDEIKKLQDDIDPEDPGSAEANIRLMNLQTIKQDLDGIDGVIGDGSNIRRIEFAKLANVARRKFLNVAQNKSITNLGASSDFREANEIMMNLQLYMLLELKRTALQTLIDESYPMGFPLKYQLIFTDDDQKALGPFDADLEKLKGQPLFA